MVSAAADKAVVDWLKLQTPRQVSYRDADDVLHVATPYPRPDGRPFSVLDAEEPEDEETP